MYTFKPQTNAQDRDTELASHLQDCPLITPTEPAGLLFKDKEDPAPEVIDSSVPPSTAAISKMAQADDVCKTEVQGAAEASHRLHLDILSLLLQPGGERMETSALDGCSGKLQNQKLYQCLPVLLSANY